MQLSLLRSSLDAFAEALRGGYASGLEALYESIDPWQAAWPPTSPGALPSTLDAALANDRTRAFWQGHAYLPKETLIALAEHNPEGVNLAFGRLFNTDLDLGSRYRGFTFYLDELLEELRRAKGPAAPPTHYHDDYRAPSLYCALRYPDTDAYFESDVYARALTYLRAPNVSTAPDPERFEKTVRVVRTFMGAHEALWAAHTRRLTDSDYREPSALLVSEYFRYLAEQ